MILPRRLLRLLPGRAHARLLLLHSALLAGGLATALEPSREASEASARAAASWVHFGEGSGLPSLRVLSMAEDGDGKLWAATSLGLASFDSFRWVPVQADIGERTDPAPRFARATGGPLLTLLRGSVFECRDGRLTRIEPPAELEALRCSGIASDPRGGWIGLWSDRETLRIWRQANGKWSELPCPEDFGDLRSTMPELFDAAPGAPLLTSRGGLWRLVGDDWTRARATKRRWHVDACTSDPDGRAWLHVSYPHEFEGVWRIDEDAAHHFSTDSRHPIVALVSSPETGVLGLRPGGQVLRPLVDDWELYLEPPGTLDLASNLLLRGDGSLLVGTQEGLYVRRAGRPRWTQYVTNDWRDRVGDLTRGSDGSLWIATAAGLGRQRVPGGPIEWISETEIGELRYLTAVEEDANGHIWVGAGGDFPGAYRFDGKRWDRIGPDRGLPTGIHRMELDRDGRLWFLCLSADGEAYSTAGPGPLYWDGERAVRFAPDSDLPSGRLYCFDHGPDGAYWFGHSAGMSRWLDGRWTHWSASGEAGALHRPRVFTLDAAEDGRVWFGHQSGGAGILERNGQIRYLGRRDGMIGEEVWEVRVDDRGWAWMSTQDGLMLAAGDQLLPFDRSTGLHTNTLWSILPERDSVTVGSMGRGFAVLHLDAIPKKAPALIVDRVERIANQALLAWRAFAPHGSRTPSEVETRYRVDGGAWSRWGRARNWTTPPLSEGRHAFEVQARGLLGHERSVRGEFLVPLAFWKQPSFYGPAALLALVLGLWLSLQQSRRRRLHAKVRASEERYRDLVENAGLPIYTHDLDGKLSNLNRKAEEVLGLTREQARGRALADFVPAEQRDGLFEQLAAVRSSGPNDDVYELTLSSTDGTRRVFEVHTRSIRREGVVVGMQSVALEITKRRALEEELAQFRKMEAIGQLAGGIAHDFNNVLLVVGGHCAMLLEDLEADSPHVESVRAILQAGERAASLTRELLAYGRKQVLRPERIDLNELLEGMAQSLLRLLGEDVRLDMQLCGRPARVQADPGQIQQVILNLGVNARDAMPRGGLLRIETRVQHTYGSRGEERPGDLEGTGWVVLSMTDSGHGMDEATRRRIFDPFFTTKGPGKGTGLGLASVYGIVQQSGGYIHVDSTPGAGATFRIFLREAESHETPAEPSVDVALEAHREGGRVLLVEDELQVRRLMSQALRGAGFEVVEASDGLEALGSYGDDGFDFQVIVSDVVMPNLSGPEMVRELEERGHRPAVLFVSGYSGDALARYGADARAHQYLQKPFRPAELIEAVQRLLGRERAER